MLELFPLRTELFVLPVFLLVYSEDVPLLLPSVRTPDEEPDLRSRVPEFLTFVPVDLLPSVVPLFRSPDAVVLLLPEIAEASREPTLRATLEPVVVRLPYR